CRRPGVLVSVEISNPDLGADVAILARPQDQDVSGLDSRADATRTRLFGVEAPAINVVYVIRCGGAMMEFLDPVRRELTRSILRLRDGQRFAVLFINSGRAKEVPSAALVQATVDNKRRAVEAISKVQAYGSASVIPAIERAFEILADAPDDGEAKAIFLLMSGDFVDNEKAIALIRKLNAGKKVSVNTILLQFSNPEASALLRKIAEENGGQFKFVILPED
ncbi:MAG TPA: hypothetical protein VM389_05195, partial [Phycisphaerae bacterium]|nr:hypothetical protein [Phycisphaerae bacterium]